MSAANEQSIKTTKFSDEVIAICAVNATLKVKGVAELYGGFTDALSKNILGKESLYKGIKVSQGEDGLLIDISVIVDYDVKVPGVAWDIQESVKREIESMIELPVKAVNIYVQGVKTPQEEDKEND